MIAVILFQINILTIALLINCLGRKRSYDGDRDVSLVQPCVVKPPGSSSGMGAPKPANDDFSVGVPPPHIPLADKSDDRTLADIESIQSEKVLIKKNKLGATKPKTPTSVSQQAAQSPGKNMQAVSPAV